jgi:glycosyltransferase involved in cell wall biosynthesis
MESEMLHRADLFVATAKNLLDSKSTRAERHYLPHGVNYEHFSARSVVQERKRPTIGFMGLVSEWVDTELLTELARRRPEWSFEIVGDTTVDTSTLESLSNVSFPGAVPYKDLPSATAAFDVGLIPFRVNSLTQSVNPLKLLEYLAMGIPVVSSPLPEAIGLDPHVKVADSVESFSAAIETALSEDSHTARSQRLAIAQANSWKSRAELLESWIDKRLDQSGRSSSC